MCAVVAHAAGTANKTRIIRALLDNVSRRRAGERRARIAALRSASHSWKLELRLVHGSRSEVTLGSPNPMFYRFTDCGGVLYSPRERWLDHPTLSDLPSVPSRFIRPPRGGLPASPPPSPSRSHLHRSVSRGRCPNSSTNKRIIGQP